VGAITPSLFLLVVELANAGDPSLATDAAVEVTVGWRLKFTGGFCF